MGLFGINWTGKKTPPVCYEKDKAGNHIYRLTDHDIGIFKSCFSGGYSEGNAIRLFETIPELFAPIDAIASRVTNGVFQLKRLKDDEIVYDNKVWNKITTQPNWRLTWHRLIYNAVVYKYTAGNRYFYKYIPSALPDTMDNISALWLLPPQNTEPHIKPDRPKLFAATSANDLVDFYKVTMGPDSDEINAELVYHDAFIELGFNTSNPLKGIGPLHALELPLSNLLAVYQARNVIYIKRGALGFIVSKKEDESGSVALTKAEKQAIREEMNADYGLTGNRDIYGITDVPVDFVRVNMSIEELKPFEETLADAQAIYAVLGVPRSFMPSTQGPTFNNVLTDERKLYQDVVIKDGKEIAQILTTLLGLEEQGLYADVSYAHIDVLQENRKEKADVDKVVADTNIMLYEKGQITKNQLMVALGMEAVPEGDVYVTDGKNPDPMAVKLGVGGLTALQALLLSTLDAPTKKNILVIVFGMTDSDAAKLTTDGNSTSQN